LTKSIDGAKTSTRFPRTFENKRGDGEIDARLDVTADKGSSWTGIDEEWTARGIVEAGGKRGGID